MTSQVDGIPKPNIVWKMADQQIIPDESVQMLHDENTGDVALILTDVPYELNQVTCYKVEAENAFGKAISKAEVMQIVDQPAPVPRILKHLALHR